MRTACCTPRAVPFPTARIKGDQLLYEVQARVVLDPPPRLVSLSEVVVLASRLTAAQPAQRVNLASST